MGIKNREKIPGDFEILNELRSQLSIKASKTNEMMEEKKRER